MTGLSASDFHLFEDGRPQRIDAFAAGEFPLSVAVALDRSFSMAGERLTLAREAARTFIAELQPDDEVSVLAVGSDVETISPFVPARAAADIAWDRIEPWGTTPLYDVTRAAIAAIQARRGRRALLLISDGIDRYSETSASELIDLARKAGVLTYPIAVGQTHTPVLAELAAVTGGRSFALKNARELRGTVDLLARELRFQYLLGYSPSHGGDEGRTWHAIEVTVDRPGVRVRARDGYVPR